METESVNIAANIDTQCITDALRVLDQKEEEQKRAVNAVRDARSNLDAMANKTSQEVSRVLNARKRSISTVSDSVLLQSPLGGAGGEGGAG